MPPNTSHLRNFCNCRWQKFCRPDAATTHHFLKYFPKSNNRCHALMVADQKYTFPFSMCYFGFCLKGESHFVKSQYSDAWDTQSGEGDLQLIVLTSASIATNRLVAVLVRLVN